MPKKHRLTHADFARVSKSRARRIHGTYFSLSLSESQGGARVSQTACVVSKKTAARAVDRNLIRRRCREALRKHLVRIKTPTVFVFHAKREAARASYAEIARDIEALVVRGIGAA